MPTAIAVHQAVAAMANNTPTMGRLRQHCGANGCCVQQAETATARASMQQEKKQYLNGWLIVIFSIFYFSLKTTKTCW